MGRKTVKGKIVCTGGAIRSHGKNNKIICKMPKKRR